MGCVALEEFPLEVSARTKELALGQLALEIPTACSKIVDPDEDVTPEMRQLAADVLKYGFVFVDVELDHQKLAEEFEEVPHIGTNYDGGEYVIAVTAHTGLPSDIEFCREQGGRCAHEDTIAMLKVTATATSPTT